MLFYLNKQLFLGLLQFQGNFLPDQTNLKYLKGPPLTVVIKMSAQLSGSIGPQL